MIISAATTPVIAHQLHSIHTIPDVNAANVIAATSSNGRSHRPEAPLTSATCQEVERTIRDSNRLVFIDFEMSQKRLKVVSIAYTTL